MKWYNRIFKNWELQGIWAIVCLVLFVGFVPAIHGQNAKRLKQHLDYGKILDYMQKDSQTELRLPTEQEVQDLTALWPTVPLEENTVFYYARAISLAKRDGHPPGSASSTAKYDGNAEAMRLWVRQNREALRDVKKALSLKAYQFPPLIDASTGSPNSGYLGGLRNLARLCTDAGFAAELEGRNDEAADWYLTAIRMGAQARRDSPFIHNLVSIAVSSIGHGNLDALVANASLSERILRRIIEEGKAAEVAPDELLRVLQKEAGLSAWVLSDEKGWRRRMRDIVEKQDQYVARQQESGIIFPEVEKKELIDARKKLQARLDMSHQEYEKYRKKVSRLHEALQKIAGKSLPQLLRRDFELVALLPEDIRSDSLIMDNIPSWERWFTQQGKLEVGLKALQVRSAIMLYQRKMKKLPERLAELYPEWLPEVPIDPFSGHPLKYRKTDQQWQVYSVGPDGKDDGGQYDPRRPWQGPDLVFSASLKSNSDRRRGK